MGGRWLKQARHTSQMDRAGFICEVKSLQWQHLQGLQDATARCVPDGLTTYSPPPPRRRWLLEGVGAAFQQVLTASTVAYDQAEHCPIRLLAWTDTVIARLLWGRS